MKKVLLILMLIAASSIAFMSCEKEEEFNNDLGGTTWVWNGNNTTIKTLKFLDENRATIRSVYYSFTFENNYNYTYNDETKKGTLSGESENLTFEKNNNKIVLDGNSYYKQ